MTPARLAWLYAAGWSAAAVLALALDFPPLVSTALAWCAGLHTSVAALLSDRGGPGGGASVPI